MTGAERLTARGALVIVLVCAVAAAGEALAGQPNPELEAAGVHFEPPDGWKSVQRVPEAITFKSPDARAQIEITLPRKANSISVEMNWKVLEVKEGTASVDSGVIAGIPCRIFTILETAPQGVYKIRDYQFMHDGMFYSAKYTALPEDFDRQYVEFQRALATLAPIGLDAP